MSLESYVCVVWVDAENEAAWVMPSDIAEHKLPVVYTVGWRLPSKHPDVIAVAQSVGPNMFDEEVGGIWYIPLGMVQRIVKLKDHPLLPLPVPNI